MLQCQESKYGYISPSNCGQVPHTKNVPSDPSLKSVIFCHVFRFWILFDFQEWLEGASFGPWHCTHCSAKSATEEAQNIYSTSGREGAQTKWWIDGQGGRQGRNVIECSRREHNPSGRAGKERKTWFEERGVWRCASSSKGNAHCVMCRLCLNCVIQVSIV